MVRRILVFGMLAFAITGCQKDAGGPAVQPVKGSVVRDGRPVGANWMVTLTAEGGPDVTISGSTDSQGQFELKTIGVNGQLRGGAPEGIYTVTVTSAIDDQQGGLEIITLPAKYEIKSGSNDLKLDVPKKHSP